MKCQCFCLVDAWVCLVSLSHRKKKKIPLRNGKEMIYHLGIFEMLMHSGVQISSVKGGWLVLGRALAIETLSFIIM